MTPPSGPRRNLYGMSPADLARLSHAARIRGISQGAYVARLLDLHDAIRAIVDSPAGLDEGFQLWRLLSRLGLATVTDTPTDPMRQVYTIELTDRQLRKFQKLPTTEAQQAYLDQLVADIDKKPVVD